MTITTEGMLWFFGFITAAAGAAKATWMVIGPLIKSIKGTIARVELAILTVNKISGYLGPNGGSSLMDKTGRLIEGVAELAVKIDDLDSRMKLSVASIQSRMRMKIDLEGSVWWETDNAGMCTWASRGYLDMVGVHMQDVIGNGWVSHIHEEDRDSVFSEWRRCAADGREFRHSMRMVSGTGKEIQVKSSAAPIRSSDGSVVGWLGINEAA